MSKFKRACSEKSILISDDRIKVPSMHAILVEDSSYNLIKKTVGKVHRRVCLHNQYSDIKLLLIRNYFWNY